MLKITSILLLALIPLALSSSAAWKAFDNLMTNYDKRIRPGLDSGTPVKVSCSIFIIRHFDFDPKDHSLKMDFYFRQSWKDPRLAFGINDVILTTTAFETLDKIWKPDTYFPSAVNVVDHSLPNPNAFYHISPQGEVKTSQRLTADIICLSYNLTLPATCKLDIESYGFSAKDITYEWKKANESFTMEIGLNYMIGKDSGLYKLDSFKSEEMMSSLSSGNYTRLTGSFTVHFLGRFHE